MMQRWSRLLAAALLLLMSTHAVTAAASDRFADRMRVQLMTDPAAALATADRELARQPSSDPADAVAVSDGLWVKAQAHLLLRENESAMAAAQRMQGLSLSPRERMRAGARLHILQGLIARQNGDLPEALRHYRDAHRSFISAGDARGQGQALTALGSLYADSANNSNAVRYLDMAEAAYRGDAAYTLTLNNNYGVALLNANRPAEAVSRFVRAVEAADSLGIASYAADIRSNIAIAQLQLERTADAAATIARIDQAAIARNPQLALKLVRIRALIALRSGQTATAIRLINDVFEGVDVEQSDSSYRYAHSVAYEIYSAANRPADAIRHLRAVRRLEDAEDSLAASNQAALLAAQFGYDAQRARIDRLNAERLQRTVAFERQRNALQRNFLIVVVAAGLALVALLVGLLVVTTRARNQARRDEAALATVNRELESALAAKSEFLASTSHEMRTPLNGIIGMAQILLSDETLPPKARGQIELVSNAGSAMRALVDDLLDVAKIEHGGFTISPRAAQLAPILQDVVAQAEATASLAGLSLDLSIDIPEIDILIDPDRLRQIIVNLVGNAIKFTEAGGIFVSVRKINRPDRHSLQIMVRDTGPGIAPEWHDSIFDLFKQVDGSRTRKHGGTGLGLAISRQLARAMGGDILLDSSPGNGSIFTVELPYQPAALSMVVPDSPAASAGIWVVGADLLRSALLLNMAQRCGQPVDSINATSLPSQLISAEPAAGQILVIDNRALAMLPDDESFIGLLEGRRVIVVGNPTDEHEHLLVSHSEHAAFALNALLPLLPQSDAEVGHPPITRLQFSDETHSVTTVAPVKNKRIAGVSERGG